MLWLEVLLSVVAGLVLGGLLLGGRTRLSGATAVAVWLVVALGATVVVMLSATEPVLDVAIAVVVAVAVAVVGAPWVVGRSDARLQALPYWSRMRADARLRADAARHEARPDQSDPPRRDLSTPSAESS